MTYDTGTDLIYNDAGAPLAVVVRDEVKALIHPCSRKYQRTVGATYATQQRRFPIDMVAFGADVPFVQWGPLHEPFWKVWYWRAVAWWRESKYGRKLEQLTNTAGRA